MVLPMNLTALLARRPRRWQHHEKVPLRQLAPLLLAVFLLFSTIGFFYDLVYGGMVPYAVVLTDAVLSGTQALAWLLTFARLPTLYIFVMAAVQWLLFYTSPGHWIKVAFIPRPSVQLLAFILRLSLRCSSP